MPPTIAATELATLLGPWEQLRSSRHRALAAAIGDAAGRGVLPTGSRLPAERALAAALGLSRGTVVAAYDALLAHEVVVRRHGSGTYVATTTATVSPPESESSATRLIERWLQHREDVIDLAMAVVPSADHLPPVELPARALFDALPGHGYVFDGLPTLRRAVAVHLGRQGVSAAPDEVVVTSGAQEAIALTAACLLRPGDVVAVEAPTYPGALALFTRLGARIVSIATDDGGVRPDALADVLGRHHPQLVYLMSTAHNPLGTILPEGRRQDVVDLTASASTPLIEDLTQADMWYGERPPPLPLGRGDHAHVIVIGSASKVLWGGLRIGWARARGPLLARLSAAKAAHDFATSIPSQLLAAELLRSIDEGWIAGRRAVFEARRDHVSAALERALPAWRWRPPDAGLSLWVDLGAVDADRYSAAAARAGVAVMPGAIAGVDGRERHHLRLSFSLPEAVLSSAVARLSRAWDALEAGPGAVPLVPVPV